jgi:hypothetical protein
MAQPGQRKCLCCGLFFTPDHRNRTRQRYCPAAACRRASHAASQAAWLARPENVTYFRGPEHVARVQAWRAAHPGYSRGRGRGRHALQDRLSAQGVEATEQSVVGTAGSADAPLQDLLQASSPVLAGLIAHLFDATLQEDIAATTRRLVQLGQDVLRGGRDEARQTGALPRAAAAGAAAVQLG